MPSKAQETIDAVHKTKGYRSMGAASMHIGRNTIGPNGEWSVILCHCEDDLWRPMHRDFRDRYYRAVEELAREV